jgi:nucleoside-diphosphate-sugar epimerase
MSRVLITGAAGFLGRNFAAHLKEQGWDVAGIDTEPGEHVTACLDARDLFRGIGGARMDYDLVLHCAARGADRKAIDIRPLDLAENLELDAALFRWARVTRPGRIVYFSSSAAYPVHLQGPGRRCRLAENDIGLDDIRVSCPDALYGWAKLTGEKLAVLARSEGLAVSVVRPFSGYGPDQDAARFPFPAFADRALRREDPFLVWGSGDQVRDWVHVDDIIGTVMTMYRLDHNGPVNIGWGRGVSVRALAGQICRHAGYEPAFEFAASAPSGVSWRVANPARLWAIRAPRVTLEQGIAGALEYRKRSCKGAA